MDKTPLVGLLAAVLMMCAMPVATAGPDPASALDEDMQLPEPDDGPKLPLDDDIDVGLEIGTRAICIGLSNNATNSCIGVSYERLGGPMCVGVHNSTGCTGVNKPW